MQKRKLKGFLIFILIISLCVTGVFASGGSANDPLVTVSYLKNQYLPGIEKKIEERAEQAVDTASGLSDKFSAFSLKYAEYINENRLDHAVADKALQKLHRSDPVFSVDQFSERILFKGDRITGLPGAGIVFTSGSGKIAGPSGRVVINITAGQERKVGEIIAKNIYYMVAADDGSGIEVTSDYATVRLSGGFEVKIAYDPLYGRYADALYKLDLFRGTDYGYELPRPATRVESLVMLIRLLGEENAALGYKGARHPFSDVPAWAEKYVSYAYSKKYTNGMSASRFGSTDYVKKEQYLTFVLRALGYDDKTGGDFTWTNRPKRRSPAA